MAAKTKKSPTAKTSAKNTLGKPQASSTAKASVAETPTTKAPSAKAASKAKSPAAAVTKTAAVKKPVAKKNTVKASGNGSAAAKVTSTAAPKAAPKVAPESASKTAAKPVAAAQTTAKTKTKTKAKVAVEAAVKSADTNKHSKPDTQQAEAPQATNSQPQTPLKSTPKTANRETNVAKTTSTAGTKTVGNKSSAAKAPSKKKAGVGRIDAQPADFVPYTRQRNEEYMSVEQRSHFKQILLDWKLQLMEEVDRTVNHMKDVAANDPDPADRATQEEEFSLELRTRDRERKLIRKIDSTIDLIDQNDYGYCESCGIEIGIQRLEARPTATQCIDCKTLDEIKERQIHG